MSKVFKYEIGDEVIVNDNANIGIPSRVGHFGKISELLSDSNTYDYMIRFNDGNEGRFKESELNFVDSEWIKVKEIPKLKVENGVIVEDKDEAKSTKFGIRNITITYPTGDANKDLHKEILNEIHDTYIRKNADYGNSFGDQFNEYGLLSLVIRLDDKLRRLKQLLKQEAQVKDESIRDTILDLSNYGIMGVMELDKQNN